MLRIAPKPFAAKSAICDKTDTRAVPATDLRQARRGDLPIDDPSGLANLLNFNGSSAGVQRTYD